MKKFLALSLLLCLATVASAKSLVLLLEDGTEVYYLLAGETDPVMTWADSAAIVNGDSYSISGITKFYISDTDDPSAVETVEAEDEAIFKAGVMYVKGDHEITVCTLDGRAVEASVSSDGSVTAVNTNALPAGTYVISFGNGALKFLKR